MVRQVAWLPSFGLNHKDIQLFQAGDSGFLFGAQRSAGLGFHPPCGRKITRIMERPAGGSGALCGTDREGGGEVSVSALSAGGQGSGVDGRFKAGSVGGEVADGGEGDD